MRALPLLLLSLLLWLVPATPARAVEIPAYTPNVVDPGGVLDAAQTQRVNEALQRVRESQQIWGALYIVPSLEGQSIEDLSSRAFEKWKLGRAGVDNGLLLVLAIDERRSRFEVGYGLEGALPDIVARHALDEYLAPRMRQGDTAGAAIAAFEFMARVVAKDPLAVEELERAAKTDTQDDIGWIRGGIAWGGWLLLVWILPGAYRRRERRLREGLLRRHPELADKNEDITTGKQPHSGGGGTVVKVFLSVNPGAFVLLLAGGFAVAFAILFGLELLTLVLAWNLAGRRYRSAASFQAFLDAVEKQRAQLIQRGHVTKTKSGGYAYTPAYHASRRSSSSSSSSRSSSSSSSGGGRSGGGGASSSW